MASYPYARVAHLLDIDRDTLPAYMQRPSWQRTDRTKTPTTLTGSPSSISSYELTVAYRDRAADAWLIYDHDNSRTTNRHIRAVRAVLESQGYRPTDETEIIRVGWDRSAVYRRYQKES